MIGGLTQWVPRLQTKLNSVVSHCADEQCGASRRFAGWMRSGEDGIVVETEWYCSATCFERGAIRRFYELLSVPESRARRMHRIPLGLILMSRGVIDQAQLNAALAAQKDAGTGKIGEWLVRLAAIDERQVTKALSEQWCCPVLRSSIVPPCFTASVPVGLLEHHRMIPVHHSDSPPTTYIAFSEYIDHSVLYGMSQMLRCRVEPCLVTESTLNRSLETLGAAARQDEVVFDDRTGSLAGREMARITRNYAVQFHADEARLVNCGEHLWVRLMRKRQKLDLLFRRKVTRHQ